MSFRNRLALFFVLIVIVPMLAVAFLLFRLIADSQTGQKEAGIAQQYAVAQKIFKDYRDDAERALDDEVAEDAVFQDRLARGNIDAAAKRAEQLVKFRGLERILLVRPGGEAVSAGDRRAVAPSSRPVRLKNGQNLGTLQVSVADAKRFAERVKKVAGLDVVVRNGDKTLATTIPALAERDLPKSGDGETIAVGDSDYRLLSFPDAQAFEGQNLRIYTLGSLASTAGDVRSRRIAAGVILLGFFLLAIVCAVLVSRSLQQQIAGFLAAARRLASGDFTAKVPTVGHDEFAELGQEFNKMSEELAGRLQELQRERERVQNSMRRLGEAVASNLDRDALLELVVHTAVDGVGADAGRAAVRINGGTTMHERSRVGNMNGIEGAVQSVEAEALRSGAARETTLGTTSAIAHPLRRAGDAGVVGVVSVGRSGRPFTPSDRDLLQYLAGQAARSLDNVELHETAARESVTDDLTGLSNRRAFDDALSAELERSKRYGGGLALVFIDLDNFKQVNDTYGHQQGDVILREVARVVTETSREIDHPARYGGEELAIVLPGTDLEGAFNLAERVRMRIAELRVPRLDGRGTMTVTASCGVAAVPPTAGEERALVAAADAALYEAKRNGKNMSVRAR